MFAAKSEDMAIPNAAIQNIASSREHLADQLENKSVDAMLAGAGGSHPLTPVLVRVLYSELSQFSFRSRLGHGDSLSGLFHKYAHVRGNGFWAEARRERRTYPEVDLQGASNDASVQKTCRPEGCSEFGLWLRCSVSRVSLRIHSFPRASPQAKFGATNVCVFMK